MSEILVHPDVRVKAIQVALQFYENTPGICIEHEWSLTIGDGNYIYEGFCLNKYTDIVETKTSGKIHRRIITEHKRKYEGNLLQIMKTCWDWGEIIVQPHNESYDELALTIVEKLKKLHIFRKITVYTFNTSETKTPTETERIRIDDTRLAGLFDGMEKKEEAKQI